MMPTLKERSLLQEEQILFFKSLHLPKQVVKNCVVELNKTDSQIWGNFGIENPI